jgi:hypothetical protein
LKFGATKTKPHAQVAEQNGNDQPKMHLASNTANTQINAAE